MVTLGGELTTMTCVLLPSTPSASLAVACERDGSRCGVGAVKLGVSDVGLSIVPSVAPH